MIPVPVVVLTGVWLYLCVRSMQTIPVQPPPAEKTPIPVAAAVPVSGKKRAAEQDLVFSPAFTTDDADEDVLIGEVVPDAPDIRTDQEKVESAHPRRFTHIRDNIYVRNVGAEGACLFNAIAVAAWFLDHPEAKRGIDQKQEDKQTKETREKIVQYISNNAKDFSHIVVGTKKTLAQYCDEMKNPTKWGGGPEIAAWHSMTGVQVELYMLIDGKLELKNVDDHCTKKDDNRVIRLLLHNVHYMVMFIAV